MVLLGAPPFNRIVVVRYRIFLEARKPPTRSAGRNARAHHTPRPTRGRIERQSPELLSGGGLHTLGGLFDKSCDSLGLRHVDGVAALDLSDRRASPPGHETLGIRWNHLVVGNDQVPTRLGLPRPFTDLAAESLHAPWDLHRTAFLEIICALFTLHHLTNDAPFECTASFRSDLHDRSASAV